METAKSSHIYRKAIERRLGRFVYVRSDVMRYSDPRLTVLDRDAPSLRRLLLRELEPLMYPSNPAPELRWISVIVPDENQPRGGLIALAIGAWLSIELLWLAPDLRGRGIGARILREAEARAIEFGCRGAYVATSSVEACGFYQRCGYGIRLRLPGLRLGMEQVTLQREFA